VQLLSIDTKEAYVEVCLNEWQHALRDIISGVDKWIDGKSPKIAENS
jgi:hypothetical protein